MNARTRIVWTWMAALCLSCSVNACTKSRSKLTSEPVPKPDPPPPPALVQTVRLAWDPSPPAPGRVDVAGYRVKQGSRPGLYSHFTDVGDVTLATVDLADGGHIVVTAVGVDGSESDPSNEIHVEEVP